MEPFIVTVDGRTFTVPREKVANRQEAEAAVRDFLKAQPVSEVRRAPTPTKARDLLAGLTQGASLGASDEVLGRTMSFIRNVPAAETIERRRADIEAAARRSPFGYTLAEIGGGAATGLGLLAGTRGKAGQQILPRVIAQNPYLRATTIGGAEGALAGFNVGEGDVAQRAPGAIAGGTLGAGLGAGSQFVAPKVSKTAQELLDKYGLPLSPESLGKGAKALTQVARQLPLIGGQFRKRSEDTLDAFNTATVNQILKPVGRQLGEVKAGQEAYTEAKAQISNAYDDLLDSVEGDVDLGATLSDMLAERIADANLEEKAAKKLVKQVEALDRAMGGQVISARQFKETDTNLREIIGSFDAQAKAPDAVKQQQAKAISAELRTLRAKLRSRMSEAVGGDFAQKLQNTDFSYKLLKVLQDLVSGANTEDRFTPKQLQAAIRKKFRKEGDQVAKGEAPLQDFANKADEVLSDLEYSTARDTALMQAMSNIGSLGMTLGGASAAAADARDMSISGMGYTGAGIGLLGLLSRPGAYRRLAPAAVDAGKVVSPALQSFNPALAMQAAKLFNGE